MSFPVALHFLTALIIGEIFMKFGRAPATIVILMAAAKVTLKDQRSKYGGQIEFDTWPSSLSKK
jgi:hypothetical protein